MNLEDDSVNNSSFFNYLKQDEFSKVSSIENLDLKEDIFEEEMNTNDIGTNNRITKENEEKIQSHPHSNLQLQIEDDLYLHLEMKELVINNIFDKNKTEQIKNSSKRKKRNKEDLDKTPLPIFDCIFCSNQIVVFKHMTREILSDKYLYNCSHHDFIMIENIISTPLVIPSVQEFDNATQSLIKLILSHSEYLFKYYKKENIENKYKKLLTQDQNYHYNKQDHNFYSNLGSEKNELVEETHPFKTNSASKLKPKLKFPFYFFDSNFNITLLKNPNTGNIKVRNGSYRFMHFSSKIYSESLPNFSNFYSNSLIFHKNEDELFLKRNAEDIKEEVKRENEKSEGTDMSNNFGSSVNDARHINTITNNNTNENFLNFLKFDLKRKISRLDVSWESEEYDIYNPKFASDNEINKKYIIDNNVNLCINNEIENFSLQFSNNSSNNNNLFDTNSNIKYNYPDKSLNVNSSHNCSNMMQFKTVLSYNSELSPLESISTLLNKTENSLNSNNLKYNSKLTFSGNKNILFNNRSNIYSKRTKSELTGSRVGWISSGKYSEKLKYNKISSIRENSLENHFETIKRVKNNRQTTLNYFSNKNASFKDLICISNKNSNESPDVSRKEVNKNKINRFTIPKHSSWGFKSFDTMDSNYFNKFKNLAKNSNLNNIPFCSLNNSNNNDKKIKNDNSKNYISSGNTSKGNLSNNLKFKSKCKSQLFTITSISNSSMYTKNLSNSNMKYQQNKNKEITNNIKRNSSIEIFIFI